MKRVTDDFVDSADHLALDEAMLLAAEQNETGAALRVWEFASHTVVLGRSSRISAEVDRQYCRSHGIPIYRRCSGGASVVGGPGCLMYSVVLGFDEDTRLQKIDVAHRFVMARVLRALQVQVPDAEQQGICDLTWRNRKCSGNSLKVARGHLLYHGTILYRFDTGLIGRCLDHAPRQPDYRSQRDHESFVTNVPIDPERFTADLSAQFRVREQVDASIYQDRIRQLRDERYDVADWHQRH